jgi:hypothetical protein
MPFSTITDETDLAKASAALETAWRDLISEGLVLPGSESTERLRLAYIVASLAIGPHEGDLATLAINRFKGATDRQL